MKNDGRAAGKACSGGLTTAVGRPTEFERARGSGGDKIGETGEGAKVPRQSQVLTCRMPGDKLWALGRPGRGGGRVEMHLGADGPVTSAQAICRQRRHGRSHACPLAEAHHLDPAPGRVVPHP